MTDLPEIASIDSADGNCCRQQYRGYHLQHGQSQHICLLYACSLAFQTGIGADFMSSIFLETGLEDHREPPAGMNHED